MEAASDPEAGSPRLGPITVPSVRDDPPANCDTNPSDVNLDADARTAPAAAAFGVVKGSVSHEHALQEGSVGRMHTGDAHADAPASSARSSDDYSPATAIAGGLEANTHAPAAAVAGARSTNARPPSPPAPWSDAPPPGSTAGGGAHPRGKQSISLRHPPAAQAPPSNHVRRMLPRTASTARLPARPAVVRVRIADALAPQHPLSGHAHGSRERDVPSAAGWRVHRARPAEAAPMPWERPSTVERGSREYWLRDAPSMAAPSGPVNVLLEESVRTRRLQTSHAARRSLLRTILGQPGCADSSASLVHESQPLGYFEQRVLLARNPAAKRLLAPVDVPRAADVDREVAYERVDRVYHGVMPVSAKQHTRAAMLKGISRPLSPEPQDWRQVPIQGAQASSLGSRYSAARTDTGTTRTTGRGVLQTGSHSHARQAPGSSVGTIASAGHKGQVISTRGSSCSVAGVLNEYTDVYKQGGL